MFRANTVLILGAGASWHYGYPTGQGLIQAAIDSAKQLSEVLSERLIQNRFIQLEYEKNRDSNKATRSQSHLETRDECKDFFTKLRANNPITIDHFLFMNPKLREIGKLFIAHVLVKCLKNNREQLPFSGEAGHPVKHDWARFIIDELTKSIYEPEDVVKRNNVKFITFNYENSLERRIRSGLMATEVFGDSGLIDNFMHDRFVHVYGSLQDEHAEFLDEWDVAYHASQKLCVIGDVDKNLYKEQHQRATQWLSEAVQIFILGFGFDKENIGLLNLRETSRSSPVRKIHFTNFHNIGKIDSEAHRLFGLDGFLGSNPARAKSNDGRILYYKSEKDVYHALAEDFLLTNE